MESCLRDKSGFDGFTQQCQDIRILIRSTVSKLVFPALAVALLTGCASFDPATVACDRFEYTDAISESWKRQMLLNMVKLRYSETPVFLDVASVINQYAIESQINFRFSHVINRNQ